MADAPEEFSTTIMGTTALQAKQRVRLDKVGEPALYRLCPDPHGDWIIQAVTPITSSASMREQGIPGVTITLRKIPPSN